MMPAEPLVGAVIILPPSAFSSFTAMAKTSTHSLAAVVPPTVSLRDFRSSGSKVKGSAIPFKSCRAAPGALRGTCRTPGSSFALEWMPSETQVSMVLQTFSILASISPEGRTAISFSSTISAMLLPSLLTIFWRSSIVENSKGHEKATFPVGRSPNEPEDSSSGSVARNPSPRPEAP